jgi:hypothetical protein
MVHLGENGVFPFSPYSLNPFDWIRNNRTAQWCYKKDAVDQYHYGF